MMVRGRVWVMPLSMTVLTKIEIQWCVLFTVVVT